MISIWWKKKHYRYTQNYIVQTDNEKFCLRKHKNPKIEQLKYRPNKQKIESNFSKILQSEKGEPKSAYSS